MDAIQTVQLEAVNEIDADNADPKSVPVGSDVIEPEKSSTRKPNQDLQNAMAKVGTHCQLSLKELKERLVRSTRLFDLKALLVRWRIGCQKLQNVSRSLEMLLSPETSYLKVIRLQNLHNQTPTGLTLPCKYRSIVDKFCCIDVETVTYHQLKMTIEEKLKCSLHEHHLVQILNIYPQAFNLELANMGSGTSSKWEMTVVPNLITSGDTSLTVSEILLERRRILVGLLVDKTRQRHTEFLRNQHLTGMCFDIAKVIRWHPLFDIEDVPDVEHAVESITSSFNFMNI